MGVGNSAGGEILRVDPEMLSRLGSELKASANALPDPPARFNVTGDDAISQAIKSKLTTLEDPIIENLPKVKTAAAQTAGNIVDAAARYQTTDEDLAAKIEKGLFDGSGAGGGTGGAGGGAAGAGAAGAGAAGLGSAATASAGAGGDAAGQLGQMMSTPMQLASQAAQAPQQVMGAFGGAMQGAMQGAQQITQMASSAGKDAGKGGEPPAPDHAAEERSAEEKRAAEDKRAAEEKREQAAGGQHRAERAPDSAVQPAPHKDSAVPDQRPTAPKHAAPDRTYSV